MPEFTVEMHQAMAQALTRARHYLIANFPDEGEHLLCVMLASGFADMLRYPDAVTGVVSAFTYGPGGQQDVQGSSVAIATGSSFDSAVQWYVKNLPDGWHAQTVGDFGALAQQLSVENLGKMLGLGGGNANWKQAFQSTFGGELFDRTSH